ncbi:hypothetical protein [Okeania sp. KiyG1]|uniref:hypothetical protein n=1 Tax=Okeania sp. KiyG1 TaxID=2720165 RepID=UPI001924984D|nr:hypothetical protein [Okeania sp. KiyG1]GGA58618.1 hypothetical protein CYANOKiyG1_79890 [Okeania sp. KiyG1]
MQILSQKLDYKAEYCETQVQQSLEVMTASHNNIYKSEEAAEAKGHIQKAIQPNISVGDFVDLDCGKIFIRIVAISKEKLKGVWGAKGIIEFSLSEICRVKQYLGEKHLGEKYSLVWER